MSWTDLNSYSGSIEKLKGKKVRFKQSFTSPNLSYQFGINKVHGAQITAPNGAIGVIYEARGATLFIGFGSDLKLAPSVYTSPTFYKATVQLYSQSLHKLEIES
jgi:hypothetical protein